MGKKFERKLQYPLVTAGLILFVIGIIGILLSNREGAYQAIFVLRLISIGAPLIGSMLLIISTLVPKDFEYSIRQRDGLVLFEFDVADVRALKEDFKIYFQNKKYLILEDGDSRIKIAYNDAVLKFLKELGA